MATNYWIITISIYPHAVRCRFIISSVFFYFFFSFIFIAKSRVQCDRCGHLFRFASVQFVLVQYMHHHRHHLMCAGECCISEVYNGPRFVRSSAWITLVVHRAVYVERSSRLDRNIFALIAKI